MPAPAPTLPKGYEATAVKRLLERCLADARQNTARLDRDRSDYLNLLFYRGGADNQWVVYDKARQQYVPRGEDPAFGGLPSWVPRCVSNKYAVKVDGISSILNQSNPAQLWAPATDDPTDRATAEVCGDAVPVLWEEAGYNALRQQVHKLITLTDKVAIVVAYDTDPQYGTQTLPALHCAACDQVVEPEALPEDGTCPTCGGPLDEMRLPDGTPVGQEYPIGRLRFDLVPGFELSGPSSASSPDCRSWPWVLLHSRMPVEEALRLWPQAEEAIRGGAGKRTDPLARHYADAMRALSSPRHTTDRWTLDHPGGEDRSVIVYRLQHDPIQDDTHQFPEGLYAVQINDEVVEAGPLPVQDDRGRPIKSVLTRCFCAAPGAPYGKPPADDLVPLQTLRNTVETLLVCILLHEAAPRTFIPLSVTLEDEVTGEPGQQIRYSSTVPGERPQTDRGINPPEGLYRYLELIDEAFEEVSRLNSVLAGAPPSGNPTLGEVQILQERGWAAFSEPLHELVEFEKALARLCLWTAKRSAWATRFRQLKGDNGDWEVKQFNASDLTGSIDVQVDPQSAWPKSPIMQLMRLEKAFSYGALMPPAQDPELQTKVLSLMALADMKPSVDIDRKQVTRALDRWRLARTPQEITPVNPVVDNLPLHRYLKTLFLKSESVEQLAQVNPAVYQAMVAHVQQIDQILAMQQAPPAPPDERSAVEKGDQSAIDAAVQSGALVPEGSGGSPLDAAVQSGALVPEGSGPPPPGVNELMGAGVLTPVPGNAKPMPPVR